MQRDATLFIRAAPFWARILFLGGITLRVTDLLFVVIGIVTSLNDAYASTSRNTPPANTQRAAAEPRLPVVVHRGGGRVVAGEYDDSKRWVSHTVKASGRSEAMMPAFEGTEAEWRGMLSCARSLYSGLPVDFVEKPPATGDYLLVMVGGGPRDIGQTRMWGLASMGSKAVVPKGVGFVFSAAHRVKDRTNALCVTLTHEVGHMLGLGHSDDCNDVMSALATCKNRNDKHGWLRGFRHANRSVLVRSLAAWTKGSQDPETRIVDNANDKTQKVRAVVVPQQN